MVHAPSTVVQLMRLMETAPQFNVQELVVLNVRVVMAIPTFHFQQLIALPLVVAVPVIHAPEPHASVRFVVLTSPVIMAEN